MNRSSTRLETRSRAKDKDEIKRAMLTIERVRKWEKKWVHVGPANCTMKIFKWMPIQVEDDKDKKGANLSKNQLTAKNRFPSNIIEDSNSNLSFPSPAPVSEDSQEAVAELASKKDSVVKPANENEDSNSNTGISFPSFNSTENSNLNEDSLDINLRSSQSIDDSMTGFSQSLIQAATAIGQNCTVDEPSSLKSQEGPLLPSFPPRAETKLDSQTSESNKQVTETLKSESEPPMKKQRVETEEPKVKDTKA